MRIGIESSRYNTNINFFEESINVCVCLSCFSKLFILNERTDNINIWSSYCAINIYGALEPGLDVVYNRRKRQTDRRQVRNEKCIYVLDS